MRGHATSSSSPGSSTKRFSGCSVSGWKRKSSTFEQTLKCSDPARRQAASAGKQEGLLPQGQGDLPRAGVALNGAQVFPDGGDIPPGDGSGQGFLQAKFFYVL